VLYQRKSLSLTLLLYIVARSLLLDALVKVKTSLHILNVLILYLLQFTLNLVTKHFNPFFRFFFFLWFLAISLRKYLLRIFRLCLILFKPILLYLIPLFILHFLTLLFCL